MGIGAVEQTFELLERAVVEVGKRILGEGTEDEVDFLGRAMPTTEQKPPVSDLSKVGSRNDVMVMGHYPALV